MKYVDEYREGETVARLVDAIRAVATRPWVVMEVCGGQTHSIVRYGIDELLPAGIELVHGPGCPVCVTPLETIDRAHAIAQKPGVIFCSFGDMLRVPGSHGDLLALRARGADVRVVSSPLDALTIAKANPAREVVLFAIGFETTAPANAMAISQAARLGLTNFSALVSHVLVPPAMSFLLSATERRVQAFLGPGHVCAIMGTSEYAPIVDTFNAPVVVTGFEPVDLLEGLLLAVRQLEAGRAELEIQYGRAVKPEGNVHARAIIDDVFERCDRPWRGIGVIPDSGWRLSPRYRQFSAEDRFSVGEIVAVEPVECISGRILQGLAKPSDCSQFGTRCTPQTPLGATMVSSEGACAAYVAYGRLRRSA
ncbi:MAG TPA: hydrogenase formation protein HypD [Kofleriaceae bacterium]